MKSVLRNTAFTFIAISVPVLFSIPADGRTTAPSHPVFFSETANQLVLSNDYFELVFDRVNHSILRLAADHTGKRNFGMNLLASDGIRFDDGDAAAVGPSRVELIERRPERVTLRLSWRPVLSEHVVTEQLVPEHQDPTELTLTLGASDRGAHVRAVFPVSDGGVAARSVRVTLRQWFLLGLFDRGAVQYVAGQRKAFTSRDHLRLFYTMDRAYGSVAIEPNDKNDLTETVLLSGDGSFASGVELRPLASTATVDAWTALTTASTMRPSALHPAQKQTIAFQIYANDLPFPAHRAENAIGGDDRTLRDSAAYFTAVYGSAAGVLGSYAEPGSAYPTLATPDRPYGDAYGFFDPDAWSTVTTLSYSGDPLMQAEARRTLERSESALRPDGQVPHHFEGGVPTYLSIAKSSQTGPNIFWVIAASEYAAGSGDEAWLRAHYGHLRMATEWVLAKYDPAHRLLRVDGPLFIDVFRRSGYTLDSNVAALYLLDRMAEVAEFCGDAESVERYRSLRRDLSQGIRDELWNREDHFITQRNPDGSTRDMVDYDGNFGALAFGVPDAANAGRLLHRLDAGAQTHPGMRGTWVSERRYEKDDCYLGNDGDSDVAMARIWWLDMAARVRLGDRDTFNTLLNGLESDLLRDVWMPERYDAAGLPAHNSYYHEYPDIVSMVLREMRYGVHVGLHEVTVQPFGATNFDLRLGKLRVSYSPDAVSIAVPGSNRRRVTVGGLRRRKGYTLSTGESVATDAEGTLRFSTYFGGIIHIRRADR